MFGCHLNLWIMNNMFGCHLNLWVMNFGFRLWSPDYVDLHIKWFFDHCGHTLHVYYVYIMFQKMQYLSWPIYTVYTFNQALHKFFFAKLCKYKYRKSGISQFCAKRILSQRKNLHLRVPIHGAAPYKSLSSFLELFLALSLTCLREPAQGEPPTSSKTELILKLVFNISG